jgi:hypothetical protein
VVMFGVESLQSLDQLYQDYEDLYQSANLLTIGQFRPSFQSNHLSTTQTSSASEAVAHLLRNADLSLQSDSATNLLAGVQYQTNNFTDLNASADTFEAVAWLLRSGANRKPGSFSKNDNEKFADKGEIELKATEEKPVLKQTVKKSRDVDNGNEAVPEKKFQENNGKNLDSENNAAGQDEDQTQPDQPPRSSQSSKSVQPSPMTRPSGLKR